MLLCNIVTKRTLKFIVSLIVWEVIKENEKNWNELSSKHSGSKKLTFEKLALKLKITKKVCQIMWATHNDGAYIGTGMQGMWVGI
jgi:hypothetical protein